MTRQTYGKKNPNLPFHPAVRAGDFIFVSGQVPKDAEGNMFCGTIEEETRWCIESVRRALKEAGADLEDVVKARCISRTRATSAAITASSPRCFPTRRSRGPPSRPEQ